MRKALPLLAVIFIGALVTTLVDTLLGINVASRTALNIHDVLHMLWGGAMCFASIYRRNS